MEKKGRFEGRDEGRQEEEKKNSMGITKVFKQNGHSCDIILSALLPH